ncbi:MAG: hypothetical protein EZS28_034987, partial [Streblomastix strix]
YGNTFAGFQQPTDETKEKHAGSINESNKLYFPNGDIPLLPYNIQSYLDNSIGTQNKQNEDQIQNNKLLSQKQAYELYSSTQRIITLLRMILEEGQKFIQLYETEQQRLLDVHIDAFFDLFSDYGNIINFELATDQNTGSFLGYGFVEYGKEEEAEEDEEEDEYEEDEQDKDLQKDFYGIYQNNYINRRILHLSDLPIDLTEYEFFDLFSDYGNIINFELATDQNTGSFLGYGFVEYEKEEEAEEVIQKLNGS